MTLNPTITRLQDEKSDREQFVSRILQSAEDEERALTDAEVSNIGGAKERIAAIAEQLAPLVEWEEQRAATDQIDARIRVAEKTVTLHKGQNPDPLPLEGRSVGEVFTTSPEFRSRRPGEGVPIVEVPTSLGELRNLQTRAPALMTTTTSPGNAFLPSPEHYMLDSPFTAYRLYDAVDKIMVGTGSVMMATYGTFAGAKTPAKVAEGALKPEVELTATQTSVTLDKWAGWVHLTEELLEDGASNGIRRFIDGELVRGIMTQIEAEIVAKMQAATVTVVTGGAKAPIEEVIRQAVATVEARGFTPTTVALNPMDAAGIDIAAARLGGANGFGSNIMPWGLRVLPVPGLTQGEAFVGDFSVGVKLLERSPIRVGITSTDQDDWVKNLWKIKAEVRAAAHIGQPLALAKTKLTP